jgi:hypothetical protein
MQRGLLDLLAAAEPDQLRPALTDPGPAGCGAARPGGVAVARADAHPAAHQRRAYLVATVVRFALYRSWVFRGHGGRAGPPARPPSSPARAARPETAPDLVQRQLPDLPE